MRSFFRVPDGRHLTQRTKKEHCSSYVPLACGERKGRPEKGSMMLRTFVEEAAALASIVLFVGMVAIWAQVIPQL